MFLTKNIFYLGHMRFFLFIGYLDSSSRQIILYNLKVMKELLEPYI